jgi:polyisoprenoid-binding protein YceI
MENQTIWRNDKDHSRLGFTVTHMLINDIVGQFNDFDLKVVTTKSNFSDASFELSAEVNSVFTNSEGRDEDLRGTNFFDTEKYPTLNFKSSSIKETSENNYKVTGSLSMHGFTKEIIVDFIYRGTMLNPNSNKITSGFQVLAKIKRSDFKVGLILPFDGLKDDVLIKMDGEFPKE